MGSTCWRASRHREACFKLAQYFVADDPPHALVTG